MKTQIKTSYIIYFWNYEISGTYLKDSCFSLYICYFSLFVVNIPLIIPHFMYLFNLNWFILCSPWSWLIIHCLQFPLLDCFVSILQNTSCCLLHRLQMSFYLHKAFLITLLWWSNRSINSFKQYYRFHCIGFLCCFDSVSSPTTCFVRFINAMSKNHEICLLGFVCTNIIETLTVLFQPSLLMIAYALLYQIAAIIFTFFIKVSNYSYTKY